MLTSEQETRIAAAVKALRELNSPGELSNVLQDAASDFDECGAELDAVHSDSRAGMPWRAAAAGLRFTIGKIRKVY